MPEQDDRCRAVTEIALSKAMEECGSEEAVQEQLGRMIGVDGTDDRDCDAVLGMDIDAEMLNNTPLVREYVFCRAWQLVKSEDRALPDALERSWAEVEAKADELGVEV